MQKRACTTPYEIYEGSAPQSLQDHDLPSQRLQAKMERFQSCKGIKWWKWDNGEWLQLTFEMIIFGKIWDKEPNNCVWRNG